MAEVPLDPALAHLGRKHRAKAAPPEPECPQADLDSLLVRQIFFLDWSAGSARTVLPSNENLGACLVIIDKCVEQ